MTTNFNFVTFNNQVPFFDDGEQHTYKGPDDFDAGGNIDQAEDFLKWWASWFDLEGFETAIKFWDGRTLVTIYKDAEMTSQITFIFENY